MLAARLPPATTTRVPPRSTGDPAGGAAPDELAATEAVARHLDAELDAWPAAAPFPDRALDLGDYFVEGTPLVLLESGSADRRPVPRRHPDRG